MLKTDRLGLINGEQDSNVESVVGSSLKMLKDNNAEAVFVSLGLSPEVRFAYFLFACPTSCLADWLAGWLAGWLAVGAQQSVSESVSPVS